MRTFHAIGLGAVAVTLATATACSLRDHPDWHDQLVADSPCYRVNLLDGLDETTPDEVLDVYRCVNLRGHFDSFEPAVDALETRARAGRPAGVELARAVNAMGRADVDVFGLAGVALDFLQAEDRPIDRLLDLSLELIYARQAWEVRNQVVLTSRSALDAGVLAPLAPVLPAVAGSLLDDDLRAAEWAGDLLGDPETKRWVRALDEMTTSTRAEVAGPTRRLVEDLGDGLIVARSPNNDRWGDASGDSVRDLAEALVLGVKGGPPVLEAIAPHADAILGDREVQRDLPGLVLDLEEGGHLSGIGPQVKWLASVDDEGGPLSASETSALAAMIRLLHATNRPMTCSIDLGLTLEVDLGNLAVTMMGWMADQDPSTIQGGAGILGAVLGWSLTDAVLDTIADTGVCPVLTRQVIDDLGALDVISGDEADDVLALFVGTLHVLEYADDDEIPAFVDLAATLHETGAVPALEEAVRDLGDHALVEDVVDLAPILVDPGDYGIRAGSQAAPDLEDAIVLLHWIFDRHNGRTGFDTLEPLAAPLVEEDGTWDAVGHAAWLFADGQSEASQIVSLIHPLLATDPDLVLLDQVGALLGDRDIAEALLRTVETSGISEGLLASRPQGDDPEVPLAFGARLVVGGALEDLLAMVDLVLGSL